MNIYDNIASDLVDGWPTYVQDRAGGQQLAFHYHDVEEWLEVLEGEIYFVSAGEREYRPLKGQALHIPRGEVHGAQVGPDGVEYRMWMPVEVPLETFANKLAPEDMSLIQKNRDAPGHENHLNHDTTEGRNARAFLDDFLSQELTFRRATGQLLDKKAFLEREPADITRTASDSVRVLHKSSDSVLLSTVVHTQSGTEGPRKSFCNHRLFVKEGDAWRCRVWINYPEPVASSRT